MFGKEHVRCVHGVTTFEMFMYTRPVNKCRHQRLCRGGTEDVPNRYLQCDHDKSIQEQRRE